MRIRWRRQWSIHLLLITLAGSFLEAANTSQPWLDVAGNRAISTRKLEKRLQQKQVTKDDLSLAQPQAAERAARLIRVLYQSEGFPLARVSWDATSQSVRFRVLEGPRAHLGEIRFDGNRALPATQLARATDWRRSFDVNDLDSGLDAIRTAYRESGYREVELGEPLIEVVEVTERDHFPMPFQQQVRQRIRLTVPVHEGERFHFGATETHPQCEHVRYPKNGETYRPSRVAELRRSLQHCFFNQGLMLQSLQVTESLAAENAVDLDMEAVVLPPLEIARIEFLGNQRFPDTFYRRELQLEEHDLLDPRKLEASMQRLLATGALTSLSRDDVELSIRDPLLVDITISLHERKPNRIEFSLTPDGLGGIDISLAYAVLNLIGLGEKLGLELEVGSHSSEAAISAASRYFLGTQIPAALGLRFFRRSTSFRLPGVEAPLSRLLERNSWGFEGGGSYRITDAQQAHITYGFEKIDRPNPGRHLILSPQWSYRNRNPRTPSSIRVGQRFSWFDSSSRFGSLRNDLVLARTRDGDRLDLRTADFRFHFSYARFFGRAEPLFDRIYAESGELRSFSVTAGPWAEMTDGSLQPVGGDLLWSFSSDYQIPVHQKVSFVPFFDLGMNRASARLQPGRILPATSSVLRASVGTELRLRPLKKLPITRIIAAWRPLRLDTLLSTANGKARLRETPFAVKVVF